MTVLSWVVWATYLIFGLATTELIFVSVFKYFVGGTAESNVILDPERPDHVLSTTVRS